MDKLIIRGMKFFGCHGLYPKEKEQGQVFEVDMDLRLDLRNASKTDDISCTVDYSTVYRAVEEVVTGEPYYNLIETLAEKIADKVMEDCPGVGEVRVVVKKPLAPLPGFFDWVGVEITRPRKQGIQ